MSTFDPHARSQLPKAPGAKIIRAGQENAWVSGFDLLANARKAYEAERTRGYTEGMEAAKQELAKQLMAASAKVDSYLASIDKEIAALALSIVRSVLKEFDHAELVARAAASALAELRGAKTVRVAVHPSVEGPVREFLLRTMAASGGQGPSLTVEADRQLAPENCIISTDFATVDATIDTQLAAIAEAMGVTAPRMGR